MLVFRPGQKVRLVLAGALVVTSVCCSGEVATRPERGGVAPVEVAAITRGTVTQRGTFSGSLQARAQFTVASRVSARVKRIAVDIGDTVRRGQIVAELDDDEYQQALAEAEAELAVARAGLAIARSALETSIRELERVKTLRERKVISESEADAASALYRARGAEEEAAQAQVTKAAANRQGAKIRLSYLRVAASWTGVDETRVVGERFVEPGDTVAANAPLLTIVDLDPITAVIHVAERDYRFLAPGQAATFAADAYPGEQFEGKVERIAPVFHQGSRQARVELTVSNPDGRLKPGMFVQAVAVLREVQQADIIPAAALTTRGDRAGVFVVAEESKSVVWREVTVGVRDGDRVQVTGEGLTGRVVTLGQQMLADGSQITIPDAGALRAPAAVRK